MFLDDGHIGPHIRYWKKAPEKAELRSANLRVNLPRDPYLRAVPLHRSILESVLEMRMMNIRRKTEQLPYRTSDGVWYLSSAASVSETPTLQTLCLGTLLADFRKLRRLVVGT